MERDVGVGVGVGVLIFDDTMQEKAWTDESELMCWHFDHCSGRTVKGINLLNALYYCAILLGTFDFLLHPTSFIRSHQELFGPFSPVSAF